MRFAVVVSYNGSKYAGWQIQPSFLSVQQVIQTILSRMHNRPIQIFGSGRTDAGVHAYGQVFHFDSDMNLDTAQWRKALNAQLPEDIRVIRVHEVPDDFHARYSALSKRYDYLLNTGEHDPFRYPFEYQLNQELDVHAMRESARLLVGTHDFSSFCVNSFEETPDQVRTLQVLEITVEDKIVRFRLEGDGFMRYMVRMLVGNLIDVGLHKKSKQDIQRILEAKDKHATNVVAPPCGLYLVSVSYKEIP